MRSWDVETKRGWRDSSGSEYVTLYNMWTITCVTEELLALLEDFTQCRYL